VSTNEENQMTDTEANGLRAWAQEIAASLPPMTTAEIRRAAELAGQIDARYERQAA